MSPLIEPHRDALTALCRQYGVARLRLFGSAAAERFDPAASDLLVLEEEKDQQQQ